MSDSLRTDTQRIFSVLLAAAILVGAISAVAEPMSAPALADPTVPELTSAPSSIGLFEGLHQIDLSKLLGAVLPNEILVIATFEKNALATALFDLVAYMRNNTDARTPDQILAVIPKYRRVEMFGTWVNEDEAKNCYNTRAEVLLRDISGKVGFSPGNPCQVSKGKWNDPYTGTVFKTASSVQVDHVIPLKNSYRSGAHAWSRERRCHFANYLDDSKHLLTVSGHENMSKGDSGPEDYLPPNETYICEYLANWMRIKASWNLQFTQNEALAIEGSLRDFSCTIDMTRPRLSDIQRNRAASSRMNDKCLLTQ